MYVLVKGGLAALVLALNLICPLVHIVMVEITFESLATTLAPWLVARCKQAITHIDV